MEYNIANMVCQRCVIVLEQIVSKLSLPKALVQMGKVIFDKQLNKEEFINFEQAIKDVGFEIITSKNEQLITRLKQIVGEYLTSILAGNEINMSVFITNYIFNEYSYLSDLFSRMEGKTLEQYFIELRIDKIKEMLVYSNKSMSDIAFDLGFSSAQHMASQFKQYIGSTPTAFREKYKLLT